MCYNLKGDTMKIFNTKILNNRQRWNRALLFGIGATLISGIVIGFLQYLLNFSSSLFAFAIAHFISWIILETGHGVQPKFSILAAVCTTIAIILSNMIGYFGIFAFMNPLFAGYMVIINYLSTDINNLISLAITAMAIYYAYGKARVL